MSCPRCCLSLGILACLIIVLPGYPAVAAAPPRKGTDLTNPAEIRQRQPAFYVRADVDHVTRTYRDGDSLSVTITSEADGFAYVLYKQADGKVFMVFPILRRPTIASARKRQSIFPPQKTATASVGGSVPLSAPNC